MCIGVRGESRLRHVCIAIVLEFEGRGGASIRHHYYFIRLRIRTKPNLTSALSRTAKYKIKSTELEKYKYYLNNSIDFAFFPL